MKKYVLVCDDDKKLNSDIATTLTKQLEKKEKNVEIIQVYTREEALEQISKRYFSLAIIDLNLEGPPPKDWTHTGGVQVIKKLKELQFNTSILVVSASPETELSFSLSKEYGIDFYIQKGQSLSTFRDLINKSLEFIIFSQFMSVNDTIETLSGLEGELKTIWENNMYSNLHIEGKLAGLKEIASVIVNNYYPFKYTNSSKLKFNSSKNEAYGEIWSYRSASNIGIHIYNSESRPHNTGTKTNKIQLNNATIEVVSLN